MIRERLDLALDKLRLWLDGLAPRERILVYIAAPVTLVIVAWLGVYEPMADSLTRLDRNLERARTDARSLEELVVRHQALSREVSRLEKKAQRGGDGSLFSQLESITVPVIGREGISSMNPTIRDVDEDFREESIDMRLEGVSSQRFIRLLHAIEVRSGGMNVERATFKRQYKDPTLLDATIVVSRLQPR